MWLSLTEAWLYTQIRFMPPRIQSVVACFRTNNLDQFPVPRIHSLADEPPWLYAWDQLRRKLSSGRPRSFLMRVARDVRAHVLHSHFGTRGWENAATAQRVGLGHVVSFYGFDATYLPRQDPRWRERYRELFATVDRVHCEAPHMAACLAGLGAPEEKIVVNHLGVALGEIPFAPREWDGSGPLRFLIAASFQEKKGIPYALEGIARLDGQVPFELTIIGDANERQRRSRLEKARILETLRRTGLDAKTRLLGYQPHARLIEEAYRHHVFLSPSVTASDGDTEGGLPYALTELVASGMPVVTTRHCDIPELVEHRVTGLLAEERDADSVAEQLRWLLDHPARWVELASAGRRKVEQEFNVEIQAERLARVYEDTVSR